MNKCLAKKLDVFWIVYVNKILIYTNKKETKYVEAVKWVLSQLPKFCFYTNFKKYWFGIDEIHFVGYIISPSGVHIESERIESIKNWLESKSTKQI